MISQRSIGATHPKVWLNPKGYKPVKEFLPHTLLTTHHHISAKTQNKVDIADLLDENEEDPALEVIFQLISICFLLLICALQAFIPQLIDHLLAQLLGMDQAGVEHEFTYEERMSLTIDNHCLY